jgi:hypothetical protein
MKTKGEEKATIEVQMVERKKLSQSQGYSLEGGVASHKLHSN